MKREFYQLFEGMYDPGIFKAFFLAGGPGSGKTYVTSKVTTGFGLRNVNSDKIFEVGLKKAGLSLRMPPEEQKERDPIRLKAKDLIKKKLNLYIEGRLGLVVDSTARDYAKIQKDVAMLRELGYDCYMIFVNTSLDVAKERNMYRLRKVPEDILTNNWNTVQQNMGKFQRLFGQRNMIIIDNNNADENILITVYKKVLNLVKTPIQNHIAKKWIQGELVKKQK